MAKSKLAWLVPATITGALIPFASIAWRLSQHRLGANPIATALNQIGLLSLIFLCASLSCTPLKIAFAWNWPLRVRRTLGLCAFFSVLLHFLVYLVLDQNEDFAHFLHAVGARSVQSMPVSLDRAVNAFLAKNHAAPAAA